MAVRRKATARKAELEAAVEARHAAEEAMAAIRELAQALANQVKELELDERAGEAVERLRSSDAYHRAQATASELAERVAESDTLAASREAANRTAASALAGLGMWLASGSRGRRLGIAPSRRRPSTWLFVVLGVGIGYGIGVLTAPKRGRELREELIGRADDQAALTEHLAEQAVDDAGPEPRPLADQVRARLGADPRTAALTSLDVTVANGTVIVRGGLADEADERAVRDVIAEVEGVDTVELQLDPTA